ncbi:MAG: phosphomevalonate kinase [Streptococcaceae bacterium]|jgi:phosphomevalonate kinase|nr:phosphomevalonate kinase [Streptococcaceae bacterium]
MLTKPLSVKVPGKLFIAGEYAVTQPNRLALIAAVTTDFTVSIEKSLSRLSHLHTNVGMADLAFDLQDFKIEETNPWRFVLAVLKRLPLPKDAQISLDIHSGLGFGEAKKGFGSSASTVVGVVNACNQYFDLKLTISEKFEIAGRAHREMQGSGSLGDVASILTGSICKYQSPDEAWENWSIATFKQSELGLSRVFVADTGKAVNTHEKLAIRLDEHFYRQSDALVEQIYRTMWAPSFDFTRFKMALLANQQLLFNHLPQGYLTEKLAWALSVVNSRPHFAGKVSGSGFGENLIVFATRDVTPLEIDNLKESLSQYAIKFEEVEVAPQYE